MAKKPTKASNPFNKEDWTHESLDATWEMVKDVAVKKYGLDFYKPHFEIVNFEDMLHIYTGSLPISYEHWSFGKAYEDLYKKYMADRMSVAYEVVFNTSPALCYLLEHNSPTMQGLVMAHASVGHSAFFKNNVVFKEMTNASTIIPFLKNSKRFISECEDKFGVQEVEAILDACHALSLYAIDRMPVKEKSGKQKEAIRVQRMMNKDAEYDVALRTIDMPSTNGHTKTASRMHEENILKFIAKFSPALKTWQRDIINIYCQIQQYLYPQMLTKLMNEGFASFWHHTIMNDFADEGLLSAGNTIEFIHSHCSVLRQPDFDERGYYGINPYKLGFEIFRDIRRICENPTEEDKKWFPGLIGRDWIEEVKFAAYNFKDESFILQYLSPKLIRDFKLFIINDNADKPDLLISDIHDDDGYKIIRRKLAESYNHFANIPDMYIEGWDAKRSRTLYVVFQEKNGIKLEHGENGPSNRTMDLLRTLWPFNIVLKVIDSKGETNSYSTKG